MSRRLAAVAPGLAPLAAAGGEELAPTPRVDSTYPAIVAVAARITAAAETPPERALRIHDLGRLEIASGLTPSFPDQRASDVLEAGVGCCSTKSTLLVALMRAREVPARRHFVDVAADQRLDTLRRAPR